MKDLLEQHDQTELYHVKRWQRRIDVLTVGRTHKTPNVGFAHISLDDSIYIQNFWIIERGDTYIIRRPDYITIVDQSLTRAVMMKVLPIWEEVLRRGVQGWDNDGFSEK